MISRNLAEKFEHAQKSLGVTRKENPTIQDVMAWRVGRGLPEVPMVEQDTETGEVFQPEYDAMGY